MHKLQNIVFDDVVYSQLGKLFNDLLIEAEVSNDPEQRDHGKWLRRCLGEKIDQHARSYH